MRQTLALGLLAIHLFGNTELGQLFRFPALIQHFREHHRKDTSIGFLEFLVMHYAGDDGTKADDNKDAQLPFHNPAHTSLSVFYSPLVKGMPAIAMAVAKSPDYCTPLQSRTCPKHTERILQPPRNV